MATTWTDVTKSDTEWTQLVPMGFGLSPFGDPTDMDRAISIHIRGFGDPTTEWKDV